MKLNPLGKVPTITRGDDVVSSKRRGPKLTLELLDVTIDTLISNAIPVSELVSDRGRINIIPYQRIRIVSISL